MFALEQPLQRCRSLLGSKRDELDRLQHFVRATATRTLADVWLAPGLEPLRLGRHAIDTLQGLTFDTISSDVYVAAANTPSKPYLPWASDRERLCDLETDASAPRGLARVRRIKSASNRLQCTLIIKASARYAGPTTI
jgi:hypothetical protein